MNEILFSKEDASVNIVMDGFEARFVQREPEYFIIYVSSHKGCNQACRFCHLTQTKQTDMTVATITDYVDQVRAVLNNWRVMHGDKDHSKLIRVNINFMARGEPLLNPAVINHFDELYSSLQNEVNWVVKQVTGSKVGVRFNISTIFPQMKKDFTCTSLYDIARKHGNVVIYYSLYSLDPGFRKRWLPKAEDPRKAIKDLEDINYKIHYALIAGENDSPEHAAGIIELMRQANRFIVTSGPFDNRASFNLVRYNPYSEVQGKESDDVTINNYLDALKKADVFKKVKVVSRVGRDVYASCGTFINIKEVK